MNLHFFPSSFWTKEVDVEWDTYSFSYQISEGPRFSCMNHFQIHVSPEVSLDPKALKFWHVSHIYNKFTKDVPYSVLSFKDSSNIFNPVNSVKNELHVRE